MPKLLCTFQGCDKFFLTEEGLQSHIRVHGGLLPFHCPIPQCGKTFRAKGNLRSHLTAHEKGKRTICPFPGCKSSFPGTDSLQRHVTRFHSGFDSKKGKEQQSAQVRRNALSLSSTFPSAPVEFPSAPTSFSPSIPTPPTSPTFSCPLSSPLSSPSPCLSNLPSPFGPDLLLNSGLDYIPHNSGLEQISYFQEAHESVHGRLCLVGGTLALELHPPCTSINFEFPSF